MTKTLIIAGGVCEKTQRNIMHYSRDLRDRNYKISLQKYEHQYVHSVFLPAQDV